MTKKTLRTYSAALWYLLLGSLAIGIVTVSYLLTDAPNADEAFKRFLSEFAKVFASGFLAIASITFLLNRLRAL